MKKTLIFWAGLLYIMSAFAQTTEFAPIGTKWWYTYYAHPSPFITEETYATLECVGDTVVDGKQLKRIAYFDYGSNWTSAPPPQTTYLYQDNADIYRATISTDTTVRLEEHLYNFAAEVGTSFYLWPNPPEGYEDVIQIMQKDSININNFWLKRQIAMQTGDVTNLVGGFRDTVVIEGIGNMGFLFPLFKGSLEISGLRCIDHPVYGHYETGLATNCDDIIISTPSIDNSKPTLELATDHNLGMLRLSLRNAASWGQETLNFTLFDLQGKQCMVVNLLPSQTDYWINTTALSSGVYVYTLSHQGALIERGKTFFVGK